MASSSFSLTSPIRKKKFKYDVFVSFRGLDTRKNFVAHLYSALESRSIRTYKDDENILPGRRMVDEHFKPIEDSRFAIVVFSKNYAASSWCLDELVKIIECNKMTELTVYPVFYDVEPIEVRKQSGAFGEAFARHNNNKERAGTRREALKEAANLAGWELKATANGDEAEFVRIIVTEISRELFVINRRIDENLVGMETRMKDIVSSLENGLNALQIVRSIFKI